MASIHPARLAVSPLIVAVWSLPARHPHPPADALKGGDDPRYAQLRSEWGDQYRGRLLMFLEIQAARRASCSRFP